MKIVVDIEESAGLDRATNTKFHSFEKADANALCLSLIYYSLLITVEVFSKELSAAAKYKAGC
jgi:hypothetical protein